MKMVAALTIVQASIHKASLHFQPLVYSSPLTLGLRQDTYSFLGNYANNKENALRSCR